MIKIVETEYWSKTKAFIFPLTGMKRTSAFDFETYALWKEHFIKDYKLIVKINHHNDLGKFQSYFEEFIANNPETLILESYDFDDFCLFIFDLSAWSSDIDLFLKGKYSHMSEKAKKKIQDYHIFWKDGKPMINIKIHSCLFPDEKQVVLDNLTPLEYLVDRYEFDEEYINKIGEICPICQIENETLVLLEGHIVTSKEVT